MEVAVEKDNVELATALTGRGAVNIKHKNEETKQVICNDRMK